MWADGLPCPALVGGLVSLVWPGVQDGAPGGVDGGDIFAFRPTDDACAKAVVLGSVALAALSFLQHVGQRHSTTTPPLGSFRRERRQPKDVLMSV
jgi:hypothetical protein